MPYDAYSPRVPGLRCIGQFIGETAKSVGQNRRMALPSKDVRRRRDRDLMIRILPNKIQERAYGGPARR